MHASIHRVRALTLAREDIRALPRQTFGLAAAGVVLGLFVPIAAFGLEGSDAMREMLIFSWLVALLVVAVILAARVAGARRTRFVDSLYTTPLEQRTWFVAQALVGAALVAAVLVAQLPFILVHLALVGMPAGLPAIFLAALGMGAFAIALGLFCGVIVGDAGAGAAAGLAGGFGVLSFILLLVHFAGVTMPPTPMQGVFLTVSALSPLALAIDAAGVNVVDAIVVEWWRPALGLAALVGGLAGAAWVAYTRAQSPVGWDGRRGRALVVALVALAVVTPVATAATSFVEEPEVESFSLGRTEHMRVAVVPPGAAIGDEAFTLDGFFDAPELTLGEDSEVDVLVMLLVPGGTSVRDLRVSLAGSERVQVVSGGTLHLADGRPEAFARPTEGFMESAAPETPARPVYRVPVTLRPLAVEALMGTYAPIEVDAQFRADGRLLTSQARMTLETNVESASTLLALAGAPLPLAAFGGVIARRIKTR